MPTYEYMCDDCEIITEIDKSMKLASRNEACGTCGRQGRRLYSSQITLAGTAVQHAEYNPAFGKVIKNKRERDELAKKHGLIEVGNESVEKLHKHFDDARAAKLKKRWESA